MGESELWGLAWIGQFIHWFEELFATLAGPVLTLGLALALIDLLTGGKLLADNPNLLWVWSASQAIGLDAQLVGSAAKLGSAWRGKRWWSAVGWTLLVIPLAYVAYEASAVFAIQQADGLTTLQALEHLGMDAATWILQRSILAVVLVVLSGLLRYVAPKKAALNLNEEKRKLQEQLELEPLRQQLRAQQVGGLRSVIQTAIEGEKATPAPSQNPARSSAMPPALATAQPIAAPSLQGAYAHPTTPLPDQAPGNWQEPDEPDDDPPGGGVSLPDLPDEAPDDDQYTGEFPAIPSVVTYETYDGPTIPPGKAMQNDADDGEPATSSGRKVEGSPELSPEARKLARLALMRRWLAENPDMKNNAILKHLRQNGLGTNNNNVNRLRRNLDAENGISRFRPRAVVNGEED